MDKAMKSFEAAAYAFVALMCFNCSGALGNLVPATQAEWFILSMLTRFILILVGFALIGVSLVKLVRACR